MRLFDEYLTDGVVGLAKDVNSLLERWLGVTHGIVDGNVFVRTMLLWGRADGSGIGQASFAQQLRGTLQCGHIRSLDSPFLDEFFRSGYQLFQRIGCGTDLRACLAGAAVEKDIFVELELRTGVLG